MKSESIVCCVIGLFLSWVTLSAQKSESFEIRGVLPWHNFLSGPSAWNEKDYEKYLNECQRQGINFIGFHNYTGGGERYATYVEPMIRISYKNIVPEACFDNSMTARWGYLPCSVNDFTFGTEKKFNLPEGAVAFGSDCSVLSKSKEEHYACSQRLMQRVQRMARERGMKMAMGFEFGVIPPEYFSLNGFYWLGEANMVPDPTQETSIEIHYAAIDNILQTYPGIDYIWLWLNEHCFMGVDASKAIGKGSFGEYFKQKASLFKETDNDDLRFVGVWALKYMQLTVDYLKKKAPGVRIILGGWGGSNQLPLLMKGLDRGLPEDVIFSCLNPGLGSQPQPEFLVDIAKHRKVWAVPWLEGDHQLWHQQPRVGLLKSHVQMAAQQNLNGVIAIHWRTEDVKLNMETFSYFAQNPFSEKSVEDIYEQYIEEKFGEEAVSVLLTDLVRWDTDKSLNEGINSPEYFRFTPQWGYLNDNNFIFRKTLAGKIERVCSETTDPLQKSNLIWLKNAVEFELLLHQVNTALALPYRLKKNYIEKGEIPSARQLEDAEKQLDSAPVEQLFTVCANKVRSQGERGVLSSINQRLGQTYTELRDFLKQQH